MYQEYFGFTEEPFGTTPDPRFFYENPVYREAYSKLAWGIRERRGLMTLVGAVGTGKTTVLRHLTANLAPAIRCLFMDYPPPSFDELLSFTCRELGLGSAESRLDRITALKEVLLDRHAQNGTTALLLDEAQHLTEETLESVRLLSNLATTRDKVLQIVLAGQTELAAKLDQPLLSPLKQRITLECRLDRLSYEEIAGYIGYRLSVAGYRGPELFGPDVVETIGFYSSGVPRVINVICGNALLAAQRALQRTVSPDDVVEVARALRIGPAFHYRVPQPASVHPSALDPISPAPDPAGRDPAGSRARGGLYRTPGATERRRQALGTVPPPATRRPLWALAVVGSLTCVVGALGLALWGRGDSVVVSQGRGTAPRPLTARASGGEAERDRLQNVAGARAPERTSNSSRPPTSEDVPPATTQLAGPPPAGPAARPEAETRETLAAAGGEQIAARAGARVPTARSGERGGPRRPTQQVVLQRGATVSGIAWSTYGPSMFLALDLVKELNPHIDNLNWVLAGQQVRLPELGRDDLVRAQSTGSYRLILDSFPDPADARNLRDTVRARGFEPVVTRRQVSNDLVLHRVEIDHLRDQAAAYRAWDTAAAAGWLPRVTPGAENPERPQH